MEELPLSELCNWRDLAPEQQREWWDQLWLDAIALSQRYRLALRSGWWEDQVQVEALGAFIAWVHLYDSGAYSDPPGKLQLLWELERLRATLRPGEKAFDAIRDRPAYERYLAAAGCRSPNGTGNGDGLDALAVRRRTLNEELGSVVERLRELAERQKALAAALAENGRERGAEHGQRDLAELERTIEQLRRRRREIRCQLDETRAC